VFSFVFLLVVIPSVLCASQDEINALRDFFCVHQWDGMG